MQRLTLAVLFLALFVVVGIRSVDVPAKPVDSGSLRKTIGWGVTHVGGKGPERWRYELVRLKRRHKVETRALQAALAVERAKVRQARRALLSRPSSLEAIRLASIAYGISYSTLYRKADCESHLYPLAKNPKSTASGLFQFLTSTFASTPYAGESIWSPYANALAAGWMHANGRSGEWVCR